MIERVDPLADAQWDARLQDEPGVSFFHGSAWARVLSESYGFTPTYFVSTGPTGRRAVLPLMEVDSWLTGRRGVSLPFSDECEPLGVEPASWALLWKSVLAIAKRRRWKSVELRGGEAWLEQAPPSLSFFNHQLDLRSGETALAGQFESSVRRAIRKAEASGLTIEFSRELEATRTFHRLLLKTRQRHGLPPQPFSFFAHIQRNVLARGQGWIVLARKGGEPVAGAVFFHSGRTVLYKYGASDARFNALRGNNLVMHKGIEWHARAGFESLDFGRTSLRNDGLRRFKLGWGSKERTINYYKYDFRTGAFVTSQDDSSGWHNRIFRRLPSPLSQMIGRALYKHIA